MPATVIVYLDDRRTATIEGCTGDPTLFVKDMASGTYRDQFSIPNDNEGLFFPGATATFADVGIQVPPVVQAALIPTGNIAIKYHALMDTESKLEASSFAISLSDEISHTPPRTEWSQLSFWGFPTNKDGVTMFQMFRMDRVTCWCNVSPNI